MNRVIYVSNAGVLLEMGNKRMLIDSLCNSTVPIYKDTHEVIKDQIIYGVAPYDRIDVMLFTHHHGDHFESAATVEFLRRNPKAVLVATPETVKRLKVHASDLDDNRLIAPKLAAGEETNLVVKGIRIRVIALIHEGKDYRDVENYAYLIEANGKRVLHVGDAKPMAENYEPFHLDREAIDLLLAPFPYVGIPKGQLVIQNQIKPKKVAAIHLPHQDLDRFNWIEGTKKSHARIKDKFVDTVFLEEFEDATDF